MVSFKGWLVYLSLKYPFYGVEKLLGGEDLGLSLLFTFKNQIIWKQ